MEYKVRIWLENETVKCCSQTCMNCPRVEKCEKVVIEIKAGD